MGLGCRGEENLLIDEVKRLLEGELSLRLLSPFFLEFQQLSDLYLLLFHLVFILVMILLQNLLCELKLLIFSLSLSTQVLESLGV